MAEVSVRVGGRLYPVHCEDGEEPRVAMLARRIDAEAAALLAGGGAPPAEPRLLLMAALLLADKLDEAESALAASRAAPPPPDLFAQEEAERAAGEIDTMARRIEALRGDGEGDDAEEDGADGLTRAERRAIRRARRELEPE